MAETTQVPLGESIRRERARRGDTKAEAAARFGIPQSTYFRWESGEDTPEDDTFAAIARYLGLKADEVWVMAHGAHEELDSLEAMRLEIAALWRMVDVQRDALAALEAEVRSVVVPVPSDDGPVPTKRKGKSPATTKARTRTKTH